MTVFQCSGCSSSSFRKRFEALGQALRVVQAVDADDVGAHDGPAVEPLNLRCGLRRARGRCEILHVDANWKSASDDGAAEGSDPPIVENFAADMLGNETPEISEINRRLKSDHVELKQRLNEPVMCGNGLKQLRRWERNVKEKTEYAAALPTREAPAPSDIRW